MTLKLLLNWNFVMQVDYNYVWTFCLKYVRDEVITVVIIKITVPWDVMPCSLIDIY